MILAQPTDATCRHCGRAFAPLKPHGKYCGNLCRQKSYRLRQRRLLTSCVTRTNNPRRRKDPREKLTPMTTSEAIASTPALFIDVVAVAARYSLSESGVWAFARRGALPKPHKIGGSTRWCVEELDRWDLEWFRHIAQEAARG